MIFAILILANLLSLAVYLQATTESTSRGFLIMAVVGSFVLPIVPTCLFLIATIGDILEDNSVLSTWMAEEVIPKKRREE